MIPCKKQYSNENAGKETVTIAKGLNGRDSWTSSTLRDSSFPILHQTQPYISLNISDTGPVCFLSRRLFFLVDGEKQLSCPYIVSILSRLSLVQDSYNKMATNKACVFVFILKRVFFNKLITKSRLSIVYYLLTGSWKTKIYNLLMYQHSRF